MYLLRPAILLPTLAALAALPSLAALWQYGVLVMPDSYGYLEYAQQIRNHSVPSGAELLHSGAGYISLFRMAGFPLLLALLQEIFAEERWKLALSSLQIAGQSCLAVAAYLAASRLGARRELAILAALLPSIGFAVVMNICVLTDSLYAVAATCAAFALILCPDWRGALLAGLLLAAATSFREVTVYFVLGFLPLSMLAQRRLLCAALVLLPVWGVAGAQVSWNIARGAGPVLTTSKELVMVQALLPLIHDHVPVYADDPIFAAAAAQTIDVAGYARISAFKARLTRQGLTGPQISAEASRDYAQAWWHYPRRMLRATLGDFNTAYLFMPFEPQETLSWLQIYTTGIRPDFNRSRVLWRDLRAGSTGALGWIIANSICQVTGTAISLVALIAPWLIRGAWTLRALWCVPVCLTLLYMPVHLEIRYLTPAVPIICVLAAASAGRSRPPLYRPA